MEVIPALEKEISKIQHLEIKPQTELMVVEIGIAKQNVDITTSFYVDWDYRPIVGEIDVWKDIKYFHFISIILQGFQGQNPNYKRGNVKGVGQVCDFGWIRYLG